MAFVNNSLGYRYMSVRENDRVKFLDVHRESDYFYGRIRSTDMIDRMIEDSLEAMRPVGINPRVGDAVICQYIHGEEADQKWHRAQIVSQWVDMYRVISLTMVTQQNTTKMYFTIMHVSQQRSL